MEEYKMQKDAIHSSSPGHMTSYQAVTQQSPKTIQCGYCTLVLKSKVYLFEHLNADHGFGVDVALSEAGFKKTATDNTSTDNNNVSPAGNFELHHCVVNDYEGQCQLKSENHNGIGNQINSDSSQSEILLISHNQGNTKTNVISSLFSAMSTSKTKGTLNSSKDTKPYNGPLETINKCIKVTPGSDERPPKKLCYSPEPFDSTTETLILEESPSDSCPTSSGVFKVTAKSVIDVFKCENQNFLSEASLEIPDLKQPNRIGKRSNNENPAKKFKSETEEMELPEKVNRPTHQQLSDTELSFECDKDEEKRKTNLGNGNKEHPDVYFCKHCDYSDRTFSLLSAHYQNDHPYIKFRAAYIQDPNDQSATFRCLECPVEFLSISILKKHYSENHPGAPNVFTMQSHEFCLAFKCFVCPFFTSTLTGLKEHYTETHPKHKMDNSLMYCKYSMARCQEGPSHLIKSENVPSPGKSQEIHHKSSNTPCKEDKSASFPEHCTSNGEDIGLYRCNNCKFSHKSVVVMHVHYRRNHPDVAVTIDKLKRSASAMMDKTSQKMPDKSPNLVPLKETSALPKTTPDSLKKPDDHKEMSSSLSNSQRLPDISKPCSESTDVSEVKSAEDGRKEPKCHSKSKAEISARTGSSQNDLLYCLFCNFTSSNVKSIIGHHNAKHSEEVSIHGEDVLLYSTNVHKKNRQAESSARKTSSDSKTAKRVEKCSERKLECEADDAAGDLVTKYNPYACPEKLFYCQKCNFGNTSAQGVLSHQSKAHPNMNINVDHVLEHTYLIRDEIEKSKSQAKDGCFSGHLPLPLINKYEMDSFFCHFCNYRNSIMYDVLRHYAKRHRGFVTDEEHIRKHSAMILSKSKESRLKKCGSQENIQTSLGKKELNNKTKMPGKDLASPARASETQRPLCCPKCPYNTQYVYLLKRHMRETHKSNHLAAAALRLYLKQGTLKKGYHCELCAFSHKKAKVVLKHYKEQHPGCKRSLNYVTTQLCVIPQTVPSKKRKSRKKDTDVNSDGEDTGDSLPSQSSGQIETKTFSCRACSFKGSSLSSITYHYRAVHPWSVKEDGSVLHLIGSKKHSANRKVQDEKEMPASFESYQAPIELEKSDDSSHQSISSKNFNCPLCFAVFPSQHGVSVHCGIKHKEASLEILAKQQKQQLQIQRDVHLYKCLHCTYVNTNQQGVLSHSTMKHPALELMIESLYVDEMNLQEMEDCVKMKSTGLRIRGHMCRICPQIFSTLEKLTVHCKEGHDKMGARAPEMPKSAFKPSDVSRKKLKTSSKVSSFVRRKYASTWCQHCSYRCTTKFAIARHLQLCHNSESVSKDQDFSYKCVLCSNFYFKKNDLGMHYTKKHGRDAFLKYYASVYKLTQKKPAPIVPEKAMPQQPGNGTDACKLKTMAKESKKLFYKCPGCRYVNASHHGTLTHCQMKHPEILARADELQTDEIFLSNLSEYTVGKGSNLAGYACKICPQVHKTLKKLKIHCDLAHQRATGAASKCSAETKKKPRYGCQDSELEVVSLKTEKPRVITASAETCQPNTPPVQHDKRRFRCTICTYKGSCRKYLHTHYKNAHKLDSFSASKLLVKYNKYKDRGAKKKPAETQPEEITNVKCKLCPDLKFVSFQPLIDHYSTFHRSDFKLDFIVLSQPSKKRTGVYQCSLCNKQLNGIRKLHKHLNSHRETGRHKAKASVVTTTPEEKTVKICGQEEPPSLETVQKRAKSKSTSESFTVTQSPVSSPSKPADLEQQSSLGPRKEKLICRHCGRKLKSITGLRAHERCHATLAAIKNQNSLPGLKKNSIINKYVLFRNGSMRPFRCSLCLYKTTVMGLWMKHFLKNHQDIITDSAETDFIEDEDGNQGTNEKSPNSEDLSWLPEYDEKPDISEKSLYLEPPAVQRQLNQYSLMAQARASPNMEEIKLESSLLHCDSCDFNTGHLSSMRRHYLNRHGRRILRCKDCNFFTGLRKTLEKHIEMGHSTCTSQPTHGKDLRCPFCLYQTKNKNNMIDHIVLHREERVVPIEVRRPKLSRYLQGIIFRCHKCTFTSGSLENLRLHMTKHDDVRPYKCRLCYFDCTHLSGLEAHLSEKHQVLRNHELVGQINVDQHELRVQQEPEHEQKEEPLFDSEHPDDGSDVGAGCDDLSQDAQAKIMAEHYNRENVFVKFKEAYQKGQGEMMGSEENSAREGKTSAILQMNMEQEASPRATLLFPDATSGNGRENVSEEHYTEGNSADIKYEDCSSPEKDMQRSGTPAHNEVRGSDVSRITLAQQCEEATRKSSMASAKFPGDAQDHELRIGVIKQRTLNNEAEAEDDAPRQEQQLDEEGSILTSACDITVKKEEDFESSDEPDEIPQLDDNSNIGLAHPNKKQGKTEADSVSAKINLKPKISGHQICTAERLGPSCAQPELSRKESKGMSPLDWKEKRGQTPKNDMDNGKADDKIPAHKIEGLKAEMCSVSSSEDEDQDKHLEFKQEEDEMITGDDENQGSKLEHRECDGVKEILVSGGAATEGIQFTCQFCGRKLLNSSDLERHILRHRI